MATNKKNTKETAVKKLAEGLENGTIEVPVVVAPTAEQIELGRIAEVVRKAYEGKGTFSEDTPDEFEKTLIGKSDDEIIEAVKPYFNFIDGSQDDLEEKGSDQDKSLSKDINQAASIVKGIAELAQKGECNETLRIQAKRLMKAQDLKEIWRCPEKGYWFSRKDYAENYKRENECSLEHYKK